MMQVSKKIPWEDSQTLFLVRAAYLLSNAIIISVYAYTHFKINQKKGKLSKIVGASMLCFLEVKANTAS
jgi:hypothetical protein